MAIYKQEDLTRLEMHCPRGHWRGKAIDAIHDTEDLVRCPRCRDPLHRTPPPPILARVLLDLFAVAGVGLLTAAGWLVHPSAGCGVLGVLLLTASILGYRNGPARHDPGAKVDREPENAPLES